MILANEARTQYIKFSTLGLVMRRLHPWIRWWRKWAWAGNTILTLFVFLLVLNVSSIRRFDTIAFGLTTFQIIVVLFAFGGFWVIRREAIEAARSEAEATASKVARDTASTTRGQEGLARGGTEGTRQQFPDVTGRTEETEEGS